jgi:hypothetical protein
MCAAVGATKSVSKHRLCEQSSWYATKFMPFAAMPEVCNTNNRYKSPFCFCIGMVELDARARCSELGVRRNFRSGRWRHDRIDVDRDRHGGRTAGGVIRVVERFGTVNVRAVVRGDKRDQMRERRCRLGCQQGCTLVKFNPCQTGTARVVGSSCRQHNCTGCRSKPRARTCLDRTRTDRSLNNPVNLEGRLTGRPFAWLEAQSRFMSRSKCRNCCGVMLTTRVKTRVKAL